MLILFAANDGLQIVLGAASAAPLQCVGSYRGVNATDYNPRAFAGQSNGTTPVEVLSGDGAEAKVIDFVTIKNPNAANAELIVSIEVAGTVREILRVVLAQHERLEYQDGLGFSTYTSAGAAKHSLNQGSNVVASGDSVVLLASDVTNNNATANTIADITGLSFPVNSGQRYWFQFLIRYTAAATTTGARFTINGPTNDELTYGSEYSLTTTSRTFNNGLTAFDQPAASNTSSASVAGNLAKVNGFIRPTANGTVIARFASEIASSAIIAKAGSCVRYRAI